LSVLALENVTTHYGRIAALQNVSMHVEDGEYVAVIGPNGAGKSTMLMSIMGVVKPTTGSIRLQDEGLVGLSPEKIVRRGIALVPEGRRIFGTLTVEDNLRLGATPRR